MWLSSKMYSAPLFLRDWLLERVLGMARDLPSASTIWVSSKVYSAPLFLRDWLLERVLGIARDLPSASTIWVSSKVYSAPLFLRDWLLVWVVDVGRDLLFLTSKVDDEVLDRYWPLSLGSTPSSIWLRSTASCRRHASISMPGVSILKFEKFPTLNLAFAGIDITPGL